MKIFLHKLYQDPAEICPRLRILSTASSGVIHSLYSQSIRALWIVHNASALSWSKGMTDLAFWSAIFDYISVSPSSKVRAFFIFWEFSSEGSNLVLKYHALFTVYECNWRRKWTYTALHYLSHSGHHYRFRKYWTYLGWVTKGNVNTVSCVPIVISD